MWINQLRRWFQSILGVDKMQEEIDKLKIENEKLMELFKEHDKAISYIANDHLS